MQNALISLGAILAMVALTPRRAEALDTEKSHEIFLLNGAHKVDLGKLVFELNQYVDVNGYEACSYFAAWISPCGASSPAMLFLDELVIPGALDCSVDSNVDFPTILVNSPGYTSSGVDKFQQGQTIESLILSEDDKGTLRGLIALGTNLPYPILIEPKKK